MESDPLFKEISEFEKKFNIIINKEESIRKEIISFVHLLTSIAMLITWVFNLNQFTIQNRCKCI